MNSKQLIAAWMIALALLVMALLPPWIFEYRDIVNHMGYAPLWEPPQSPRSRAEVRIDFERLGVQFFAALAVGTALFATASRK